VDPLTDLDRRIIGALQVNGRCSWRHMAEVLGESERTVTRRGTALLEARIVRVTGLGGSNSAVLGRFTCAVGSVRTTATALAQRPDCVFAYALTGGIDCCAEIRVSDAALPALVLDELPATVGLVKASIDPELRIFRSVRQWRPGLLTEAEVAALAAPPWDVQQPGASEKSRLTQTDRAIVRHLRSDGRATAAELARTAGVTEATVRRRLDWMQSNGELWTRAVVEPALLGFPVEAMLWIQVAPHRLEKVAAGIQESPAVRWAVAIGGEYDLAVNLAMPDQASLYTMLTSAPWVVDVQKIETSIVLQAMKRSGVRALPASRPSQ
jgi:DNA-binding Lrp family transcriptional regulator